VHNAVAADMCVFVCDVCVHMGWLRLLGSLKIIGLFCRISSLLQGSFAKETYNFKEPTNRSHPIVASNTCTYVCGTNTSVYVCHV